MHDPLVRLMAARRGHFLLESGHHGDLWLDLPVLCQRPTQVQPFARTLAQRLKKYDVDAVCGPLVEGSFIALMVAAELDVAFSYAERVVHPERAGLYPVEYRVPGALCGQLRGKRVAIVNDVINAGSAVRGTFNDLRRCGARPVSIGALLVLGSWASTFATEHDVDLTTIRYLPNRVWIPVECPLCSSEVPLEDPLNPQQ